MFHNHSSNIQFVKCTEGFLEVNRFLSYNMQQIRGQEICNETCLGTTMRSAALPLYGRRPRELALTRRRWSCGILRGPDGRNGTCSSCPPWYGCMGNAPRVSGNLSLDVRGHLFTQAYLQNGYCVLSPVWSAKEAARLTRTLRCWDSLLGFLNSRFVASFCATFHFCFNGRFKKHMKQLNECVSCPHQATRRCAAFHHFYVSISMSE